MSAIEIENELAKMTNQERFFVIEIATKLIRREMGSRPKLSLEEKRAKLRKSGEIMLSEYLMDKELTTLIDLDGEGFLDV